MALVSNVSEDTCDECDSKLLPVKDEVYCPICDVGEKCLPDGNNEFNRCLTCKTKIAGWYIYEHCPNCLNN